MLGALLRERSSQPIAIRAGARAETSFGLAVARCWGALKGRFTAAKYEDLPVVQYGECLRFIRQSYAEETGGEGGETNINPRSLRLGSRHSTGEFSVTGQDGHGV